MTSRNAPFNSSITNMKSDVRSNPSSDVFSAMELTDITSRSELIDLM